MAHDLLSLSATAARAAFSRLRRHKLRSASVGLVLLLGAALGSLAVSLAWLHARGDVPFPEQERLVRLQLTSSKLSMPLGWSFPFLDAVARSDSLVQVVPYREVDTPLASAGGYVGTSAVIHADARLFGLLGLRPIAGRLFTEDETRPGSERVVVVGHELGARMFGPRAIAGNAWLQLAGERFRVIGVLAPGQAFPAAQNQAYVPLRITEQDRSAESAGSFGTTRAIGLLRPGAPSAAVAEQAAAQVQQDPTLAWFANEIGLQVTAEPIRRLWTGATEGMVYAVFAASIVLLVICVANGSNLFLLRLLDHQGALAVQHALGASHARLLLEILCEALFIALAAFAVAFLVAGLASAPLSERLLGTDLVSASFTAPSLGVAMLACAAFTVVVTASGASVLRSIGIETLRRGQGQTLSATAKRMRTILSVAQVSACVALVAVAGAVSLYADEVSSRPMGFGSPNTYIGTLREVPATQALPPEATRQQLATWVAALSERGEVDAVGLASSVPFGTTVSVQRIAGSTATSEEMAKTYISLVDRGYLRALGAQLLQGSLFAPEHPLDGSVAVVERSFVRRFLEGADPIGRTVRLDGGEEIRVVGVVGDVLERSVDTPDAFPTLYRLVDVPFRTHGMPADEVSIVLRTRNPADTFDRGQLAQALARQTERFAVVDFASVPATIEALLESQLQTARLIRWFALIAAILCVVAIYSLISHATSSSMREFALRQALGANRRGIVGGVIRQGLSIGVTGWAAGLVLALGALHLAGLELVAAIVPYWLLVGLAAGLVSGGAALLPALKASRVDLVVCLRSE